MTDAPQRALQMLVDLFTDVPPLASLLAFLLVLGVALWSAGAAWHSYRVLDALANAPLTDLRSHAEGTVKLRGTAQPPPPPPGYSASEFVWRKSQTRFAGRTTTSTTVGHFLVKDEHGVCVVDIAAADIVATTSESGHAFLDTSRTFSKESIRTGDPVTAIGELRRDLPAPPGMGDVHCQLVPSGGVLLVSGSSERQVRVLYGLWFGLQFPVALLCACVVALAVLAQLARQEGFGGDVAAGILDRLLSTEHLETDANEAVRELLAIGPPYGVQLSAEPVVDYGGAGWLRVDVAGVSMFAPPGWTIADRDESAHPSVGLVAPGNDAYMELRVLPDVLRRPGIVLEDALQDYANAKERAGQGIVLGYAPLSVDGAIGHIEIMNSGGSVTNPDGSLAHRLNSYRGARRAGEMVYKVEFRTTFEQSEQDRFGPVVLNAIRSIRFGRSEDDGN